MPFSRDGEERRGIPLSKLTFVRAQDLCINVPSILPICVCSFQMRITTTATKLFFFLVLQLVVSIEMQQKQKQKRQAASGSRHVAGRVGKLKSETYMAYV